MDVKDRIPKRKSEPVFGEGFEPQGWAVAIAVIGTFLGCWAYAMDAWGWFLGLAFGWLPSAILAAVAGYAAFHLYILFWVLVLIGLVAMMTT